MARLRLFLSLLILFGLWACSPSTPPPSPTPTLDPSTPTPAVTSTPSPIPTATPLTCLTQPGQVVSQTIETTKPVQEFLIYLPPCYDFKTGERYPVLYLLHGQGSIDDEWVRLGATTSADYWITSGAVIPFIIVFPDDRYWNLPPGAGFGDRLVHNIIPYVDDHFRTLADRDHRALGGLSRGGGWTVNIGLTHYELFGALGLHSPAVRVEDSAYVERWIRNLPPAEWPRVWIDAGDQDGELSSVRAFESLLSRYQVPHEWHLYTGDHSENYWRLHVAEYLLWYAEGWKSQP